MNLHQIFDTETYVRFWYNSLQHVCHPNIGDFLHETTYQTDQTVTNVCLPQDTDYRKCGN